MKKCSIIIVMLIILFLFCGCKDGNEPDTLGYVVAIGFDKTENGKEGYDITLQFANPAKISGGSGEDGGKKQ